MHPSLRALFAGTRDESSTLHALCGHGEDLLTLSGAAEDAHCHTGTDL